MKVYYKSEPCLGQKNEDALSIAELTSETLAIVVADGMGGLSNGDMAASTVCTSAISYIKDNWKNERPETMLKNAVEIADNKLSKVILAHKESMGAAVAVVFIQNEIMYCTWQGNVRVYACGNSKYECLTQDHVLDTGYGEKRLTRCLKGQGVRDDLPVISQNLSKCCDYIAICTDGFYEHYEDVIAQSIERHIDFCSPVTDDLSVVWVMINEINIDYSE